MTGGPVVPKLGDVIIVGGGCYGTYYVRQLQRAARAAALAVTRLVVVDRDPSCQIAGLLHGARDEIGPIPISVQQRDWGEFFTAYLTAASEDGVSARDAIVPSPLMPHLMAEWLVARARSRWPGRAVTVEPVESVPDVPWSRAGADATHYVSFATWMCPVNCIEPRICPHTKGERTWSLPVAISGHTRARRQAGPTVASVVLHCSHRAYGVGMFDTADVVQGDRMIAEAGERGPVDVLIGTVSHCHGALTRLLIS